MKIGIRNMVIPGARRVMIVVIMLTAPRIVPSPEITSPMIHISGPMPGLCWPRLSGVYAVQPKSAAPSGVSSPPSTSEPPSR